MFERRSFAHSRCSPAEDVQRQITVAIVIAVEEAPLLMPVQRIIGGVQVQHDLLRGLRVSFKEQLHQQPLDRFARGRIL